LLGDGAARMVTSQVLYGSLVLAVAIERLFELRIAARNRRTALAKGGTEFGARHFPAMSAMHTAFLISCVAEVVLLDRPLYIPLAAVSLTCVIAAQVLRYWCIATLGPRWNVRVIVVPGMALATDGPYRFLRHPNYVAVVIEVLALPLVHTAWLTAIVFSLLNAAMLTVRIRVEEAALQEVA
jgi:methyltransferase